MTHYSDKPSSVRVDFYKPSGKWYMTEAWDMDAHYFDVTAPAAVENMLLAAQPRGPALLDQFIVVVQSPYHRHDHPVMLVPPNKEEK